ncbi:hypothetical protein ACLK1T_17770 [Escherichia coli]
MQFDLLHSRRMDQRLAGWNCLMSPVTIPAVLPAFTGRRAEQDIDELHYAVEYRPATGNRGGDSPTAYAPTFAVVTGKRPSPALPSRRLDVHSLWVYGLRCATGYLPHG